MVEKKEYVSDNARLMPEWDWEKNREQENDPRNLTCGSGRKVWWKCNKGHEWQATIASRNSGCRCPYCAGVYVMKGETDLQTVNPTVAKEWNFERNNSLRPTDVMPNSGRKVWWKCNKGHEWQATIGSRNSGYGCPYCAGLYVAKGETDLQTVNPALTKEWDFEKNNSLRPEGVLPNSHTKVWWKCSKGHSWEAAVSKRSLGQGCPFCAGTRVLKGYNDLNTTHPELVEQWDDEKNEKRADEFSAKSNKKAWWKCSRGHSWEAAIAKRVLGQRCPYCVGKTVLAGFNDLGTTHPHLVQEWDYDKNLDIMPTSVSKGSTVKVWWKCKRNHSWSSAIYSRVAGVGCPHCAKELQSSFPEKAIYFYVKKAFCDTVANYKSELLNTFELDIFIPSLMVGIEYDGERWHQEIEGDLEKNRLCSELGITLIRVREPKCPVLMDSRSLCIIRKSKRSGLDEVISKVLLEVCRKANVECSIEVDLKKDYASIFELLDPQEKENNICLKYPSLEKEWDYEKNEALRPDMLTSGSDKRVWWICDQGHSYQATVSARVRGRGCSICAGKQILKGFNDLESKCPTIAKDWDYQRNPISPDAVAYGSDKVYWWKCELGHSYDCSVNNRRAGQTCPFCSGKRVLVGFNDLATTHPKIARQWCNELNETHPTEVSKGSHKRVWWECEKCGYRWLSAVYNRCGNGSNCPRCSGWKGRKK